MSPPVRGHGMAPKAVVQSREITEAFASAASDTSQPCFKRDRRLATGEDVVERSHRPSPRRVDAALDGLMMQPSDRPTAKNDGPHDKPAISAPVDPLAGSVAIARSISIRRILISERQSIARQSPPVFPSNSGSRAILTATRRASSLVSTFACRAFPPLARL